MSVLNSKVEGAHTLVSAYNKPASKAAWANKARNAAQKRFLESGVPIKRDEYWRYTDPSSLTSKVAEPAALFDADESPVFDAIDKLLIVFVDGVFRADLSDDLSLEGVEVEHLGDAMNKDIHWAKDLYGVLEENGQNPVPRPLAALNTAVAEQGVVIRATGQVSKPIALRYIHENTQSDAVIHNVVQVDSGAKLTLLENGPAASRFNKSLEVNVADGAEFHHVRAQGRDHERRAVTHMFARLGKESVFKSFTLTVNGVLTRNECVIELTGDDAHARVSGACAGDGDFLHDDTVFITHDAVNCESRQVFKKVLRNGATGVFQGKILVQPDAQKTDGYQISQGLLLDDDSNFLAKPELEIYADDVACSHGSTCGEMDETSLFYLMSRGIPRHEAQNIMVLAFMDEAIQEIEDEALADDIRARLGSWMERRRG